MNNCVDDNQRREQEARRKAAIDAHVGTRIRLQRSNIGMTAKVLADILGVTYQQVHFYETSRNKISAANLFAVAQALNVPTSFFFDDMPDYDIVNDADFIINKIDRLETLNIFSIADLKVVEAEVRCITHAYYLIESPILRRSIVELMKTIGKELQSGTKSQT